jgi:hypothetical protein
MEGGAVGHNFERDTSRDHLCQVWTLHRCFLKLGRKHLCKILYKASSFGSIRPTNMAAKINSFFWLANVKKIFSETAWPGWACIAHLTIEWYWSKFQRELIITLKNSNHLEWRVGLSDTIMTEQYRTISPEIQGFLSDRRSFYWTCPTVFRFHWDLTTHTSLSPIRRGFKPCFVNYKKGYIPFHWLHLEAWLVDSRIVD